MEQEFVHYITLRCIALHYITLPTNKVKTNVSLRQLVTVENSLPKSLVDAIIKMLKYYNFIVVTERMAWTNR